jgi:cytochrome P450 family 6/cytochrome P450 family 28
MQYLDQVLSDSLRLHPILSVLVKLCTESTELVSKKDKRVKIDKGTSIIIPVASISLDDRHFENAQKFDPDRFSPENGGTKPYKEKCVYFPFGDGPRQCLGMRFGVAQVKRGIIEIVHNFEISVNKKTKEPLTVDPDVFLISPTGGLWLDYKPISK